MKKYILICLSLCLIFSCSDSIPTENIELSTQEYESNNKYLIDINSAIDNLYSFMNNGTKSFLPDKKIENIIIIPNPFHDSNLQTKAELVDSSEPLLYVANFENNQGYAVLSADSRLKTDVYAITEKGNITSNEINYNNGPSISPINTIYTSASNDIRINYDNTPTLNNDPGETDDNLEGEWVVTSRGEWTTIETIPTMLKTKWHQRSPFNNMIEYEKTGCTTIALFQIVAYNKYPKNHRIYKTVMPYDSLSINETIENDEEPYCYHAALFVSNFINCSSVLEIEDGILIFPDQVEKYLKSIGYINVSLYRNPSICDTELIDTSLEKGYPVFIAAVRDSLHGHSWVIDGKITQARSCNKVGENSGNEYDSWNEFREYYHCNWGWSGLDDGYYFAGIFDNDNMPTQPTATPFGDGGSASQYDSFYRIITYDIPK